MTSTMKAERTRAIVYWVATALLVFELVLGGMWDVLRVPHVRVVIERLGYPLYFLVILGVWKLLGAVALVIPRFPRLKEWAYAGVIFNLTGALVSHVASGDIEPGPMSYLVVMVGITATSWSLRRTVAPHLPSQLGSHEFRGCGRKEIGGLLAKRKRRPANASPIM